MDYNIQLCTDYFHAKMLLWQHWAKRGRWESLPTYTALTSLLCNPPAADWLKSLAGSKPSRPYRWLVSIKHSPGQFSSFIKFCSVDLPEWKCELQSQNLNLAVLICRCHKTSHFPVQMSAPRRHPGHCHSCADLVIIIPVRVSLVSATAERLCCFLFTVKPQPPPPPRTPASTQSLAGI